MPVHIRRCSCCGLRSGHSRLSCSTPRPRRLHHLTLRLRLECSLSSPEARSSPFHPLCDRLIIFLLFRLLLLFLFLLFLLLPLIIIPDHLPRLCLPLPSSHAPTMTPRCLPRRRPHDHHRLLAYVVIQLVRIL
ncbi:hypothetical protein BDZ91DRAFT_735784 [Kalaharituber pfeilii]|nr:hypothetical protein BDZ91DRAFT_735784 [Kalaharituber pfeilii]